MGGFSFLFRRDYPVNLTTAAGFSAGTAQTCG